MYPKDYSFPTFIVENQNKLEWVRIEAGEPVGKLLQNVQVIDNGSSDKVGGSGEGNGQNRKDV